MNPTEEAIKGLREQVEKVLARPQDFLNKEQAEKMFEAMLEKAHPTIGKTKMELAIDNPTGDAVADAFEEFKKNHPLAYTKAKAWDSAYGKKVGGDMRSFLRAVKANDSSKLEFLEIDGSKATSDGQTEGTSSTGGYLVPTDFQYEVIKLLYKKAIIRNLASIVPMGTLTRTLPTQLTNVAVGWVAEGVTRLVTKGTFGQFSQTAKVMAAVIKSTDEFLRDSAVNVQQFMAEMLAGAMAREEERIALAGDVSGAGDPFNGVLYKSGVVSNSMAGSALAYDDLVNQKFSIADGYEEGAQWVLNRTALKKIIKLKDANGQYIWSSPRAGQPGDIDGDAYSISGQLPTNLGSASNETPILYGAWKNLWISDRAGLAVLASQSAADWVSGALDSAFMSGQTWLRFTKALSIDVVTAGAFAKQNVK